MHKMFTKLDLHVRWVQIIKHLLLYIILTFSADDSDETDGLLGKLDESLIGKTRSDKLVIYWVSYLDHQQRVLLFTQDERVAKGARKVGDQR